MNIIVSQTKKRILQNYTSFMLKMFPVADIANYLLTYS